MNFISVDDVSKEQINSIFEIADDIKNGEAKLSIKENAVLTLLFQKPSTRTRVSFEAAMAKLDGRSIYLDMSTSQMSRGETLADTARVLSGYSDFIAARLFKHDDIIELANNSSVPVINALTDMEHPTQALSDLYTIREIKNKIKGIKIAFFGDIAQNTINSLMLAGAKLGAEIALAGPKGYQPNPNYLVRAREYGPVEVYNDSVEAADEADVIYTDTFVSMGKEAESEKRKGMFKPYQVNASLVAKATRDVIVMHPLPAFRGEEITKDVIDGPKSVVWQQSKNKMLMAESIILYLSEKNM